MRDVDNLERAIEKLGVELVLLRNCTYPGVARGDEAVKFLSALNRKKQAVVCEYGDDRLKHRIGRRANGHRTRRASRNGQEVVPPVDAPGVAAVANPPPVIPEVPEQRPLEARIRVQEVHRPIPVNNFDLARRIMAQQLADAERVIPAPGSLADQAQRAAQQQAAAAGQAAPEVNEPRRLAHEQPRVVIGAHIYEFRANVPADGGNPAVHNVDHLLNVIHNNAGNDVRVIVLPGRQDDPHGPINFNNNENFNLNLRQIYDPVAARPLLPGEPLHFIAPVRANALPHLPPVHAPAVILAQPNPLQEARIHYELPAQLLGAGPVPPERQGAPRRAAPAHVAAAVPPPGPPVPMFGDAVNEPQVQRNGDDSNDSTDREEMAEQDVEQRRDDALRDLVADPTAQPNFAPVEAEAVDLDMLEEDAEGEDSRR